MQEEESIYDELCLSIYNTNRYFHRLYAFVLDRYDLSYLQYMSLLVIHQRGGVKLMDIGDKLGLSSNTLTPVIDKLVQKNWLKKEQSAVDKRINLLKIKDSQSKLLNRILVEIESLRNDLIDRSGVSVEETLQSNQHLNHVLQLMIQDHIESSSQKE
ncbi:MarR family winged helix-turn-helix transcriptional regulator [Leuconostoc palmae]|uniref:MarR family winged helix-turn-helix transcriptional regulator n=1 Tax=Leuconostoc palmae TaxID=501487 RepID=UPI001C7DF8CA|nr:MarR family transcriptional regulator [Leuconostoc palmae]